MGKNLFRNTSFAKRFPVNMDWDVKNGSTLATDWNGKSMGVPNATTCWHAHLYDVNGEWVYRYKKETETWLGTSQWFAAASKTFVPGKTYTFSGEFYRVSGGNYPTGGLHCRKLGSTTNGFHAGSYDFRNSLKQGEWVRCSWTFTLPDDFDVSFGPSWFNYGSSGGAGEFYARRWKLEEGTEATPWSVNPDEVSCYIPSDLEIGTLTATNGALFKKETDNTCIRTTSPINHYFQDFGIRIPDGYKLSVFQYGADGRIVTTSPYSSGDYGFLPLTLSSSAKTLGLVFKKNDDTAVSTQDINNLLGFGSDSVMAQDTKTIAKVVDGTGITNVINYYLASNQATGITVPGGNPNMVRGSSALTMGNGQWSTGTFRISDSGGTVSQIAITDCPASGVTKGIRITSNGTRQIGIAQDGYQMQPGFYTQSWWIKGNAGQKVRVDAYYRDNTDTTGIGQVITLSKTGWNQIIHTAERKSADTLSISYAFLFPTATSGEYIDVAAPMLVRGKFPADWAPAPEDSGWTQTPQQTSDSKRYLWHYRVELHDDGTAVTSPPAVIGVYGQKGDQGNPGTNGTNGANAYVHIAYADSADGVTGFSNTVSTGKTYIGQYSDNSPTHSQDPSKYKWTLIKGADGAQGIPGAKGADGRTPYFHVAYATNATGTSGFSVSDSVGKTYIGQYTDYTSADSTDPTKYSWTLIKGDEGKPALSIAVSASWNRYELTLTAHVYEGGVELNSSQIAAIGAIKWYRNNGSAVVGTGTTITRAEYTRATYEARLEG